MNNDLEWERKDTMKKSEITKNLKQIKKLLDEYKPISGTFYDRSKQWYAIKNYNGGPPVSPILFLK